MAIAYQAVSESHSGTGGSVSEASFSWTHTPGGTPRGLLVFVMQDNASTDKTTSVTYDGIDVPPVSGGFAADTSGEIRACKTFFLGSSVPTGPKTVVVNRTNDTTVMYAAAVTVTAATDTQVYLPGIVLQQADTALVEQSVSDGSTGIDSVRFGGGSFALNGVPGGGASSTAIIGIDFGSQVAQVVRETTAGQGSRSVGFSTATVDDVAAVYLAVREAVALSPGYNDTYGDVYSGGETNVSVVGQITFTGQGVPLALTQSVSAGAVSFTGQIVGLTVTIGAPPSAIWDDTTGTWDSVIYLWDGQAVTAGAVAVAGRIGFAGGTVGLRNTVGVTAGAFRFTGATVTLVRLAPPVVVTAGVLAFTGQVVGTTIRTTGTIVVTGGQVAFVGASVAVISLVAVQAGAFDLSGQDVGITILTTGTIQVAEGRITFTGRSVLVISTGPPDPVVFFDAEGPYITSYASVGALVDRSAMTSLVLLAATGTLASRVATGVVEHG